MIIAFLFEYFLDLALGVATALIAVWAFLDVVRRKPAEFESSYKRTKGFWLGLTGAAAAVGLLSCLRPGTLLPFTLAALVAASVYLADVKPAISGSGRGNSGPYGRW